MAPPNFPPPNIPFSATAALPLFPVDPAEKYHISPDEIKRDAIFPLSVAVKDRPVQA